MRNNRAAGRSGRKWRSSSRRTSPAAWIIPGSIAVAAGACLYIFFCTGIFAIREIRVHGGRNLPVESLRESANRYIGSNVFTVPLSEIRRMLMEDPAVGRVSFRRRPPHKLDCYLRQREPVALINCGDMAEVDEEGIVVRDPSLSTEIDLPVITGIESGELETKKGKGRVSSALVVLGLLKEFGFSPAQQLSEIHMEGDEVILVWLDSGTIIRVGSEDFRKKILKLRAVYGALKEQDDLPELVDLRFEKQVVVR
jgi:cell division septal protein FtsQ